MSVRICRKRQGFKELVFVFVWLVSISKLNYLKKIVQEVVFQLGVLGCCCSEFLQAIVLSSSYSFSFFCNNHWGRLHPACALNVSTTETQELSMFFQYFMSTFSRSITTFPLAELQRIYPEEQYLGFVNLLFLLGRCVPGRSVFSRNSQ